MGLLQDLKINIKGVNVLDPVFEREKEVPYKHYHLEITATKDQEMNLKKRLLARGLAIDIKPFNLADYQQTHNVQSILLTHCVLEGGKMNFSIQSTLIQYCVNCRK